VGWDRLGLLNVKSGTKRSRINKGGDIVEQPVHGHNHELYINFLHDSDIKIEEENNESGSDSSHSGEREIDFAWK